MTPTPSPAAGLTGLDDLVLNPPHQRLLDAAAAQAQGSPVWRHRKRGEARELLALAQIAPRLQVLALDLRTAFRAMLLLDAPVPCRPDPQGPMVAVRGAHLALHYPEEALRFPLPGYAFLSVLAPRDVWHANVAATEHDQRICLGAQLPVGIPVRELVLSAYGALTLQTVQIDERSAAGVLNAAAARDYQQHPERMPLSRVPFLGTDDLAGSAGEVAP